MILHILICLEKDTMTINWRVSLSRFFIFGSKSWICGRARAIIFVKYLKQILKDIKTAGYMVQI